MAATAIVRHVIVGHGGIWKGGLLEELCALEPLFESFTAEPKGQERGSCVHVCGSLEDPILHRRTAWLSLPDSLPFCASLLRPFISMYLISSHRTAPHRMA